MMYRIYTGADGLTRSEAINLLPPAKKDYSEVVRLGASNHKAVSVGFQSHAPGFFADWHTVPHSVFTIQLSGRAEYGLGDGTVVRLEPGDVVLVEDTWGKGHTTRVIGDQPRNYVGIQLAPK